MNTDVTNNTEAAIVEVASDNTSGAAEILRSAANVFSLLVSQEQSSDSADSALQTIIKASVALVNAQPDMSSILRLASEAVSAARSRNTGPQALMAAIDAANGFVDAATASARAAATQAAAMIAGGSTLLTHSRSSTVLEAFLEARRAGKSFEVIATESRPMFEGRKLATELERNEITITLIADAAAALLIDRADIVFVGADTVTPTLLVNKIGTRMIALAARERGRQIFAVCDSSKFIADDSFAGSDSTQRNTNELWPDRPEGVNIINRYFEPIPLSHFTGIITERGTLSDREASDLAAVAYIDSELSAALLSAKELDD